MMLFGVGEGRDVFPELSWKQHLCRYVEEWRERFKTGQKSVASATVGAKAEKKVETGTTLWLPAASLTHEEEEEKEKAFDEWSCRKIPEILFIRQSSISKTSTVTMTFVGQTYMIQLFI